MRAAARDAAALKLKSRDSTAASAFSKERHKKNHEEGIAISADLGHGACGATGEWRQIVDCVPRPGEARDGEDEHPIWFDQCEGA